MSYVAIRVENLSKRYRIGQREPYKTLREAVTNLFSRSFQRRPSNSQFIWALKDVSFEVKRGEVIGIIGRNGAGKTTLLKVLSRITKPTRGYGEVFGRVGSLLEVGTGFHPELTGRENIYLNGAILGMKKTEIVKKFDEIVEFAEIEKFIDTPMKRYSSGMFVRLAFAVAAHLEPEILLVDEVLAVGDAPFQKKCLGKMGDVVKEGRTVLFVSHNMVAVAALCQKGMVLEEGGIAYYGEGKVAIEQYLRQFQSYGHVELSERQDRGGSGVCRFTRLTFEDANGQPLRVLHSGQTVRIVIDYESGQKADFRSVKAVISISHSMYGQILHCGSTITGDLSSGIPPNGRLVCTIKALPLMRGLYSVTIFLKVGSEIVDWINDAATLEIEHGDFYGTSRQPSKGIFLADYSWDIM